MILTYQVEPNIYTVAVIERNSITRVVGLTKEQAARVAQDFRKEQEQ